MKKIAANPDFFFRLDGSGTETRLLLVDRRGRSVSPDYKKHAGAVRSALREYSVVLNKEAETLHWERDPALALDPAVYGPSPRLVDLAAASGLLADESLRPLRIAPGEHRLGLNIRDLPGGGVAIDPIVLAEDGEEPVDAAGMVTTAPAGSALPARSVTSNHLVVNGTLYRTTDLGPFWDEAAALSSRVKRKDLLVFLSFTLSRFPALELRYGSYTVQFTEPRVAEPALAFKEIDQYGYLHVRPVSWLPGYPPGFFEDQEIVNVVEFDEEEKLLGLAEVLFPVSPDEEFRALLVQSGKEARNAVYEEAGRFILEPHFAERFLADNMATLMARFKLFESSLLGRYKLRTVTPKLRFSLGRGIDYLEGTAQVDVEGQIFSYGRFLAEFRKEGYLTLNDGSRAYPDQKDVARMERLIVQARGADDQVSVSFFDLPALTKDVGIAADGEAWSRAASFYQAFNDIPNRKIDAALPGGNLRPYQEYGVKWLEHLRDHSLGGCLADEMGLGKTVQVIALLKRTYASGEAEPSLILMPRSLLFNWQSELARFAPELPVLVHYGLKRDSGDIRKEEGLIVLSSYATARNDIEALKAQHFCYLVLDESQSIKNSETKTTGAVLSLEARHRLALSGTPVENNMGELYSLFKFLNPSFFGTAAHFSRTYLRPIQERQDRDALRDLKTRLYPFLLRRLKRDVLPDLPPKTEQTAYIELDPAHLACYHRRRLELKARIELAVTREGVAKSAFLILQALTELRRLAGVPESDGEYGGVSAKREYLRETVAEIAAGGHKCLIFTNYLASVELVSEDLAALGIPNLVMTGATGDRQSLVRRFQSDPEIKAFIMTLKTGGLGLNLTAADYVFIFDPWWNRSAEAQAIDRTHRIGQENPVFCYRMIARETVEEKILELQERKVGLVSSLLAADENAVKALDEQEIAFLLG